MTWILYVSWFAWWILKQDVLRDVLFCSLLYWIPYACTPQGRRDMNSVVYSYGNAQCQINFNSSTEKWVKWYCRIVSFHILFYSTDGNTVQVVQALTRGLKVSAKNNKFALFWDVWQAGEGYQWPHHSHWRVGHVWRKVHMHTYVCVLRNCHWVFIFHWVDGSKALPVLFIHL